MRKRPITCCFFLLFLLPLCGRAQNNDLRLLRLQQRLDSLSSYIPGLEQKVALSISGLPLKEYLRALGKTAGINIQTEGAVNPVVNNTLSNVPAANILLLLAQQYNLDIRATGIVLIVSQWEPDKPRPVLKDPLMSYRRDDNSISFDLNGDSLVAVARKVTRLTGHNVLVPATLQGRVVSAFVSSAPFDVAMEKLGYGNELKMVRTSDNFYLFQPLEDGEQLYVNGDRNTAVRRVFNPLNTGAAGSAGIYSRVSGGRKLLSVSAVNASIAALVQGASQELNKSYFVYSDIKGQISSINATDLTYENFLKMIFKGTPYSFLQEDGVYMIGERRSEGLRSNRAVILQNRSIDTVMAMIPAEWRRDVEIKEFREQNTILLSGARNEIDQIADFIHQIDLLVPQVLIEVNLIDVRKTRRVATGISAGVADSVRTGGTLLSGLDFTVGSGSVNDILNRVGGLFSVNIGKVVPNFYVKLSALESQDNVEVRSVPKLATLNGHTASLSIGNTVYYKNTTQNIIPSATSNTSIFSNVYQQSDANLTINIRPVVSGDDQVTLGIKIDISDFTALPTDGSPPPKSTSKFESLLRVHNEDMIVLGGIERTESSENRSGTPILSRIPIIKYIFSTRTRARAKVVTLVFIKATILR